MKRVAVTATLTLCLLLAWAIGASLAATPWQINGVYMDACSCDIPCPCNTGGMPTQGFCRGVINWHIAYGFYGDVSLNGINVSIMDDFNENGDGKDTIATYISDNASPEQVEAIKNIIQEAFSPFVIEKDLSVKLVPIAFGRRFLDPSNISTAVYDGMSGDTYTWSIPDILELESTLVRDMPDVPGYFAPILYQAQAVVYKYKDYDRDWDYSGKNSNQGRLLLPPEELSDKVVGTVRVGVGSQGVAVNPYTRTAVVTNLGDDTISLIDLNTQKQVKTIPVGNRPFGPAIDYSMNVVVVPNGGDNTVSIVDLETGAVKKVIPVGNVPTCAGVDSALNIATVPNLLDNSVSVIDLKTMEVTKTIPVGMLPVCMHWSINPFTKQAVVALMGEDALSVIDLEEGVEIKKIPVGTAPQGSSLNPYTNIAVTCNLGSNDVSIVDLTKGEVINTIPVDGGPACSVIEPTKNLAIVASAFNGKVNIIDLNSMSVVDSVTGGVEVACLALDEENMTVLSTGELSNDVTIIDLKKFSTATEDYSRTFFLQLESGLNMISLPLKPLTQRTARSLMNEVGATMAIKLDAKRGRFVGFTEADAGDGFAIEGGQGYIVNVKNSKVVPFVGAAWTNEPPLEAAPTLEADSAWAFVVSGALNSSDDKTNFDGYTIQAQNLRTGVITTDVVSKSGYFALASADLSKNSIIQAGDKLEMVARDASGDVFAKVVRTIDADNIGKAYLNVHLRLGNIIPSQTALLQNYPNPFNPETWIPFALAEDSLVTINIYDTNGQLVRRFDLGRQVAGIYTPRDRALYWDGRNETGERVSSGVYFYQLRAGQFNDVRRLVIIK